jgi:hypothetical protein
MAADPPVVAKRGVTRGWKPGPVGRGRGALPAPLSMPAPTHLPADDRSGYHRRAADGTVYLWALATVFATATVLAGMRWRHDAHLFAIATGALALGLFGWRARRRHRPGWVRSHAIGMGGSYIALLTGFYVDNGPQLPLWNRLPHPTYWLLPTAVGAPLIWWALRRFRSGVSSRPRTATRATVRR